MKKSGMELDPEEKSKPGKEEVKIIMRDDNNNNSKEEKPTGSNFALFISEKENNPEEVSVDDTKFKYVKEEVDRYSITPTTFKFRTLSKLKEISEDFTWYVDEYSHGENAVLRYGINAAKIDHFSLIAKITDKERSDSASSRGSSKKSNNSGSKGLNPVEEKARSIKHEKLEKFLIEAAIEYLLSFEENRVVLVDIFVRNSENELQLQKNGGLETHTVVLYKNPLHDKKYKILVIDPSNFSYSNHISNMNGLVKHALLDEIVVLHNNKIQIYKAEEKNNVGPNHGQFRDCIDISVKLAFVLFKKEEWLNLDIRDIQNSDVIKQISNISKIDKYIIIDSKPDAQNPVRIKQASDGKTIKNFYILEQAIYQSIAKIDASNFEGLYNRMVTKYLEIVNSTSTNAIVLHKLEELCKECLVEHKRELDKYTEQLLSGLTIEEESL